MRIQRGLTAWTTIMQRWLDACWSRVNEVSITQYCTSIGFFFVTLMDLTGKIPYLVSPPTQSEETSDISSYFRRRLVVVLHKGGCCFFPDTHEWRRCVNIRTLGLYV
jgi:hypothetical protein